MNVEQQKTENPLKKRDGNFMYVLSKTERG